MRDYFFVFRYFLDISIKLEKHYLFNTVCSKIYICWYVLEVEIEKHFVWIEYQIKYLILNSRENGENFYYICLDF